MKLKLVVASMSVLGLISCDVLAATQAKHKHHHHRHHKAMMSQTAVVVKHDYKDMGALPVEVCPVVDNYTMVLDAMSHNTGRALPTVHCRDPLSLAGGMNFDANWGNRHIGYSGENVSRFSLNDAYVNVFGNVNDWTQAFASLSYANFTPNTATTVGSNFGVNRLMTTQSGVYSASYAQSNLQLEQGFVTFRNWNVMPAFVRVGKMFQDFGRYNIHPITQSMTQVMSETLHTGAQLGFVTPMGFNGSVYTFENDMRRVNTANGGGYDSHNKNNYGVSLNYSQPNDQLGYDLGVGYMYDFTGVNGVRYSLGQFNAGTTGINGSYQTRVSAAELHGNLNSGPFSLALRYVTALQSFSASDLATRTISALALPGAPAAAGAKPWSADITAGYGFNAWNKDQNVYLGYQGSGNAVNLFLPRSRWMAGYGVNVWKSTNLGVQFNHDMAYSATYGGTGTTANGLALRAAVQFG